MLYITTQQVIMNNREVTKTKQQTYGGARTHTRTRTHECPQACVHTHTHQCFLLLVLI